GSGGSGSGGCDAGFGAALLALAGLFVATRKKK
ncbi:MAG: SYNERG-CTERM sorting domain-containing protein, partial [Synergistaceae bacterium]|nr:SYNERG-CTERM sorting domain-containing protein [Synergistaceae bacterium]